MGDGNMPPYIDYSQPPPTMGAQYAVNGASGAPAPVYNQGYTQWGYPGAGMAPPQQAQQPPYGGGYGSVSQSVPPSAYGSYQQQPPMGGGPMGGGRGGRGGGGRGGGMGGGRGGFNKGGYSGGGGGPMGGGQPIETVQEDTIFISGMDPEANEDEIAQHFGAIGIIKIDKKTSKPKIWLYRDKDTGKPKGEATVTYDDSNAARSAIQWFDGKDFKGAIIKVQMAIQKSFHNNGSIGYGGGRGGGRGGYGASTGRGGGPPGGGPGARQYGENKRDGDWTCPNPNCSNANFSWRSECNRCGGPRPPIDNMSGGMGMNDGPPTMGDSRGRGGGRGGYGGGRGGGGGGYSSIPGGRGGGPNSGGYRDRSTGGGLGNRDGGRGGGGDRGVNRGGFGGRGGSGGDRGGRPGGYGGFGGGDRGRGGMGMSGGNRGGPNRGPPKGRDNRSRPY